VCKVADKQRLLRDVAGAGAAITHRPLKTIAIFIRDVPAKYILESAEIAPEPGEERAWTTSPRSSRDHGGSVHRPAPDLRRHRGPHPSPGIEQMRRRSAPEFLASFRPSRFPGQIPDHLALAGPLPDDTIELEGHDLVAVGLGHTDTGATTCLHVAAIGLVGAGDAAYDDVHLYLAESSPQGRRDWIAAPDTIASPHPRAVIAGHKRAFDRSTPRASSTTRCSPYTPTASTPARSGRRTRMEVIEARTCRPIAHTFVIADEKQERRCRK
jgi:hypothetical protein